jgi:hypothetical protein
MAGDRDSKSLEPEAASSTTGGSFSLPAGDLRKSFT